MADGGVKTGEDAARGATACAPGAQLKVALSAASRCRESSREKQRKEIRFNLTALHTKYYRSFTFRNAFHMDSR